MPSILDPIPNSPFYSLQTNSISTPQGYVIAGSGVAVDQFGYLNVASALGGTVTSVTAGTGLSGGAITVAGVIDLVPATNVSLGGVKVGANLLVAPDGTLSALPPGTGTVSSITTGSGLTGGGFTRHLVNSFLPHLQIHVSGAGYITCPDNLGLTIKDRVGLKFHVTPE